MRARLHHLILDCPDPRALAEFYSRLLDQPITYDSDDFVVVAQNDRTSGLGFQRAPGHRAPTWPDPAVPQQMHLDVMVEDPAAAGADVLQLGRRGWTATSTRTRPAIPSASSAGRTGPTS
jgi:catechol 2,3-dioxygenase-like lactoylglutathione lyase family enzyme